MEHTPRECDNPLAKVTETLSDDWNSLPVDVLPIFDILEVARWPAEPLSLTG